MGSSTKTLLYRYDAVGNRVGLTDGDGGRFTYVYDAVHRLSRVINPQGDRTTFSYDAAGRRREKALANGTRASFTYDLGNRLSRVLNLASGPTTLSSFDYRYDKSGNRTVIIEGGGSSRVTYSYDGASRLVGEHRTGGNPWRNTFSYDSRGNRTLKNETGARTTSVYDAANQLVSSQEAGGRTTYTFDANGNQARVLSPSGDRTTTSWDYENKTTLVRLPAGVRNTMSYNPQGLRVVLADSGGVRKFVWDEEAYLAETDGSDDTQVVYTQEPGLYGRLISQRRGGVISYHHYDGLGSTRRLTNVAQSTTDTYLYDAWGSLVASTGSTINPFRYVGELGYYYDPDTGNSYIRARIYAPPLGRWLSIDPLLFVDGLNLYRAYFVPNKSDPSGSKCSEAAITALSSLLDTSGISSLRSCAVKRGCVGKDCIRCITDCGSLHGAYRYYTGITFKEDEIVICETTLLGSADFLRKTLLEELFHALTICNAQRDTLNPIDGDLKRLRYFIGLEVVSPDGVPQLTAGEQSCGVCLGREILAKRCAEEYPAGVVASKFGYLLNQAAASCEDRCGAWQGTLSIKQMVASNLGVAMNRWYDDIHEDGSPCDRIINKCNT